MVLSSPFSQFHLLRKIKLPINLLFSLTDKWSKTNPKFLKGRVEQEFTDRRNRTVMLFHILQFICHLIGGIFQIEQLKGFSEAFFAGAVVLVQYISCKYWPALFKVGYSFILMSYSPTMANAGKVPLAWSMGPMSPVFTYLITESFWCSFVQGCFQAYFINFLFQEPLLKSITFMEPKQYVKELTQANNFNLILGLGISTTIYYFMQRAYESIINSEEKKDEYEKQKTFLLSFSHELRNLVNSIAGHVRLAALEENLTLRTKELLQNAEVCGELLLHLINNILDTGKVEIGELEINPIPTSTYPMLEKVWSVCSELIWKKGLQCYMKIQKNMPETILIDHYRLTQIFLNLIGNAIKFTETPGSIQISVEWISGKNTVDKSCFEPFPFNETDEGLFEKSAAFSTIDKNLLVLGAGVRKINSKNLKVNHDHRRGILKVVVRDSGCGMTQEEQGKLFQRFSQVTQDLNKRKMGTGLGLFITKQLCHRMLGDIQVFSRKDKGSAFILCVPAECIQAKHQHEHQTEFVKKFLKENSQTAMIVDDELFNRHIMKNFFERINVEISSISSNGLEAFLDYKKSKRPNIIALDLNMPVMDGKEAAQKIREFEIQHNLKPCILLIVSANCIESEIAECLDQTGLIRADAFVKKPASIDELLKAIGLNITKLQK